MKAFELVETHHEEVACDGSSGSLGHPRVYLHIDPTEEKITCPYCSKTFILKKKKNKPAKP